MRASSAIIIALALTLNLVNGQTASPPPSTIKEEGSRTPDLTKLPLDGWSTEELIKIAEQGDYAASMRLARYWYFLSDVGAYASPQNMEARFWSKYWLNKAAADGQPVPRLYLEASALPPEVMDEPGKYPDQLNKTIRECNKLAEEGDLDAITALATVLPSPGEEQLNQWYAPLIDKAEKTGDADLAAALARNLVFGQASHDGLLKKGMELALKSARQGNPDGMKTYGQALVMSLVYSYGQPVSPFEDDEQMAQGFAWLNKAADLGHIEAMETLLVTIRHNDQSIGGQTPAQLDARESELMEILCQRGQLDAMINAGKNLVESGEAPQKGLQLLDRAAAMGSFTALELLAKYYSDNNHYVPMDIDKSFNYARRLADLGAANGYLKLAEYYERGLGVPKDEGKAYSLVTQAVEAGLDDALVEQARMMLKGAGTSANPAEAFATLQRLSKQELHPEGVHFLLGYIHEGGLGTPQDFKKAHEHYTIGAEAGDTKAMNNLASMYEAGMGVEKNPPMAKQWYEEAAKAGNEEAKANLSRLKAEEQKKKQP